jgi:hypothetical protein
MYNEIIKVCRDFLKHEKEMTKCEGPMWTIGVARGHLHFIAEQLEQKIKYNAEA